MIDWEMDRSKTVLKDKSQHKVAAGLAMIDHYVCSICNVKGWHYWYILKIIISIKPYLVKSNGGRLKVWNIVGNGSLRGDLVFYKEVIFHESDF